MIDKSDWAFRSDHKELYDLCRRALDIGSEIPPTLRPLGVLAFISEMPRARPVEKKIRTLGHAADASRWRLQSLRLSPKHRRCPRLLRLIENSSHGRNGHPLKIF
jgi:hypothetical protein